MLYRTPFCPYQSPDEHILSVFLFHRFQSLIALVEHPRSFSTCPRSSLSSHTFFTHCWLQLHPLNWHFLASSTLLHLQDYFEQRLLLDVTVPISALPKSSPPSGAQHRHNLHHEVFSLIWTDIFSTYNIPSAGDKTMNKIHFFLWRTHSFMAQIFLLPSDKISWSYS